MAKINLDYEKSIKRKRLSIFHVLHPKITPRPRGPPRGESGLHLVETEMAAEGHRKTAFSMRKHFQPRSDGYFHIFFSFVEVELVFTAAHRRKEGSHQSCFSLQFGECLWSRRSPSISSSHNLASPPICTICIHLHIYKHLEFLITWYLKWLPIWQLQFFWKVEHSFVHGNLHPRSCRWF